MFTVKKKTIQQFSISFFFMTIAWIIVSFIENGVTMKGFIKPVVINFTIGLIFAAVLSAFVEKDEDAQPSNESDSPTS